MWLILSSKKYAPWNEWLWVNLCSSWNWTEIEGLTYCSKVNRVWLYEKFTTEIYYWFHCKWKCFGWASPRRVSSVLTEGFTGWCSVLLMEPGRNFGVVIGRTAAFKPTVVVWGLFSIPSLHVKCPAVLELNTASWKDSRASSEDPLFLSFLFFFFLFKAQSPHPLPPDLCTEQIT